MTRLKLILPAFCTLFVSLSLTGCWIFESADSDDGDEQTEVAPENPEGDTSIPSEEGGPGFEPGEDWVSVDVKPLGDPRAVKGGSLQTDLSDWPKNLRIYGPGANTYFNSIMETLMYETLCQLNPHTLEFYPRLASHWKISDDQMTFTFRINPRAHWSDGTPVTADDVIATHKLLVDDSLNSPSVKEIFERMNPPKKLSKYMVEVTCKEKDWRNFIAIATNMMILPAHEIGSLSGEEYNDKYNNQYTVVSGPYNVLPGDIKTNESIAATRRDQYWGYQEEWSKGLYNIDKIRFKPYLEEQAAFQAACKGDLDFKVVNVAQWWVQDLDGLDAVQNGHLIKRKVFTSSAQGIQGMAFNMRRPPLDDLRVRKALVHLYDRRTMLEKFAFNQYDPMKSYFTNLAEAPENQVVEYDPKQAIQLLEEAGWTERGTDGIRIKNGKRLSFNLLYRSKFFEKYLTTFQSACKSAGIEILLKEVSSETHFDNMNDRNFEIASMAWTGSLYPSPKGNWHSTMADPKHTNNITGFKSSEVDRLIESYDKEFDQQKRIKLLQQMDKLIFEQHPYALDWYLPCERFVYWNKFGTPETVLPLYSEWRDAFSFWWVDPSKEQKLRDARKNNSSLPIPEVEVHFPKGTTTTSLAP